MLSGNILIDDRFIKYIAIFAASAHKNFGSPGAVSIIVRIRIIIVLIDRSVILF
jgi:hypothetical protein